MIKKTGMVLVLIVLTAGVLKLANAKTGFMDKFDANYSSSPLKGNCMVCHTSPPKLNPYGTAYEKSDEQFDKIESQDSDGDGFTNLSEILAGTFPGDPTSNPSSPPVTDGATLYAQNCAGCHGSLAQSTKLGRTAAQIQNAINANVGNMGGLSSLSAAQVQAIADVLAGQTPPPPPPPQPPTPVTDGPTLYAQSCASCHGPLAQSTKLSRTAAQIQNAINANVGNMGGLSSLTASQVQAIADALAGQTPPPPLPPPPPSADGPTLYAQSCASCHGPLAQSTKIGRTAAQIQDAINANVGGMGILGNLTPSHVQAIADALAAQTPPPPLPPPPPSADGPTLYAQSCASCHGPLTQSSKLGRTAAQIQDAINANVGGMGILSNLTPSHVQAIAGALAQKKADTTPPKVASFSVPSTSSSLTVTISAFAATDDVGVTGYMVTESATAPLSGNPKWNSSVPPSYTFATPGTKKLYAWAKDAAGNVSSGVSATTDISSTAPPSAPDEAPDLTVWVGKWFRLAEKNTGYQYVKPDLTKMNASYTGYLNIWEWDPVTKVLRADRYEQDGQSGQWASYPLTLHFFGGTQLDFLCWSQESAEDYRTGFTAHIYGQNKSGELAKASFKSLGGFFLSKASGSANQNVGGVMMTGVLISGADVPVPQTLLAH